MSEAFHPISRRAGTLTVLACLAWVVATCGMNMPAYANVCEPVDPTIAQAAAHPNYLAHMKLTAEAAKRAVTSIDGDDTEAQDLREGLLIALKDKSAALIVWRNDGSCMAGRLPPRLFEQVLHAIQGRAI